jgi:hypothetical protein
MKLHLTSHAVVRADSFRQLEVILEKREEEGWHAVSMVAMGSYFILIMARLRNAYVEMPP